jgi:hypothetical protein
MLIGTTIDNGDASIPRELPNDLPRTANGTSGSC